MSPSSCEDERTEDILRLLDLETATVRKITLWIPEDPNATDEEIRLGRTQVNPKDYWVIYPDNVETGNILYACNLPDAFKQDGLWIIISGKVLKSKSKYIPLAGLTAFSLTHIEEDYDEEI